VLVVGNALVLAVKGELSVCLGDQEKRPAPVAFNVVVSL